MSAHHHAHAPASTGRHGRSGNAAAISAADRKLIDFVLRRLHGLPVRFVLWNGEEFGPAAGKAVARMRIRSRIGLWMLPFKLELLTGDAFVAGDIDVSGDLTEALKVLFRAWPAESEPGLLGGAWQRFSAMGANSLGRSRANIHSHYDLGNDFYQLWLGEDMAYTCAYYTSATDTLDEAQRQKMHHVCRKLRLRANESVVEAGCGWGALACLMARHYGVRVTAYNISHEQILYARELARRSGLEGQVEFIEDDYRNITGDYDVFVSVGMLEHVGRDNYQRLGEVIDRSLKENGRGLIHSVGRNSPKPMGDWIEKRIFPGSYVPSLAEMIGVLAPREFSILDVENLRLHYARTLADWLERFDRVSREVERMYDAPFVRAWRLYLAGCSASFSIGLLQLFQVLFTRPGDNDIPWTRAHLYDTKV